MHSAISMQVREATGDVVPVGRSLLGTVSTVKVHANIVQRVWSTEPVTVAGGSASLAPPDPIPTHQNFTTAVTCNGLRCCGYSCRHAAFTASSPSEREPFDFAISATTGVGLSNVQQM